MISKDSEISRLSWIIWEGSVQSQESLETRAEGRQVRAGKLMAEAEVGDTATGFDSGGSGHKSKKAGSLSRGFLHGVSRRNTDLETS